MAKQRPPLVRQVPVNDKRTFREEVDNHLDWVLENFASDSREDIVMRSLVSEIRRARDAGDIDAALRHMFALGFDLRVHYIKHMERPFHVGKELLEGGIRGNETQKQDVIATKDDISKALHNERIKRPKTPKTDLVVHTAKEVLEISPGHLRKLMKKFGIKTPDKII